MKFLEKVKGILTSKVGKIVGFVVLGVGNVVAITVTTLAWFALSEKESKIQMVSGDLGVEIQKVTAYKYVYPYYKNSIEFIDYDGVGSIKPYIIEDHTLEYDGDNVDDITFGHDNAVITLGNSVAGTYSSDINATHTASNIYFANEDDFRYYLIGDAIFCGDSSKEWSIKSAIAFKNSGEVTNNNPAIVTDIVVSAGASFILFDKHNASAGSCLYFPYSSIDYEDTPFRIDDGKLLCLRSGIYNFTYTPGSLSITLKTVDSQKEIAVIGNNSLDPTKVTIDYAGSGDKQTYPNINSYLPHAIHEQNTMLILDVQIKYTNKNPVTAGLMVERNEYVQGVSIYYDSGKYNNTSKNLVGYVNEQNRNALKASDFYSFYAIFTKTPYSANDPSGVPQAIWDGVHVERTEGLCKFQNDTSYDRAVACTLNPKDQADSLIIPSESSGVENIYHCYIGIDYDYVYTRYFLNENRLGKTYLLDRDFGFHFTGVQYLEQSQGN